MKLISALILLCLIGFVTPSALAQSTTGNPGEMRAQLLRPVGWIYDWKQSPANKNNPNNVGETGNGEMVFQARGDAIVVTIYNLTLERTCERDVTLSGDTVMLDLCFDRGLTLRFDPADKEFPYKGGTLMYEYR